MSLRYPFSAETISALSEALIPEFNRQTGSAVPIDGVTPLLTLRPKASIYLGLQLMSKRRDDFLQIRVHIKGFGDNTLVGRFDLRVEQNYAPGDEAAYWYVEVTLQKHIFNELITANRSAIYQEWLERGHHLRLPSGAPIILENGRRLRVEL